MSVLPESYKNLSLAELGEVKANILEVLSDHPGRPDAVSALIEVNQIIKTKGKMKFYHVTNSNRTINAGGLAFTFHPYEHVGTWLGVYATEKEPEITALDAAVKNPKSGVTEISQDQYEASVKKKLSASNSYAPSLAVSTPTPGQAAPSANEEVGKPVETNLPPAQPINSIDEAIKAVPLEQPSAPAQ